MGQRQNTDRRTHIEERGEKREISTDLLREHTRTHTEQMCSPNQLNNTKEHENEQTCPGSEGRAALANSSGTRERTGARAHNGADRTTTNLSNTDFLQKSGGLLQQVNIPN